MSGLLRSSAILAFARCTNYAILLLSPVVLVRVLDPYDFGRYREFMVYATLTASLASFSIPANLLYFIPHSPDNTRHYLSHTNWLTAVASLLACVVLWLFRGPLLANTSYDFLAPLAIYVMLFINLDVLESFWIATKRANNVFYYTTTRTAVRLGAVVTVALLTRSVEAIIQAIIFVEAARILVVVTILHRLGILTFGLDPSVLRRQLTFVVPLGLAGSLHYINESVGQIAISTQLGVVALATYTIASYQVPVLGIVRSAIGDAIFPDMVQQAATRGADRLQLWKRSNVAYTFILVPTFIVLLWYADVLIPFVFSERYLPSVPLFRVLLLVMLVQCFEFSSPLRAANRNPLMLVGNILMIGVNVLCIAIVFQYLPEKAIFGPAIGIVAGYVAQLLFLGWCIMRVYRFGLRHLLKWGSLAKIAIAGLGSVLMLLAGEYVPVSDLARVLLFSVLFFGVYYWIVFWTGVEEVETITKALLGKLPLRRPATSNSRKSV